MCIQKNILTQTQVKLIANAGHYRSAYTTNTMNPSELLVSVIDVQRQKENEANIWKDSKYRYIAELESNNVGNVGENLIQKICESQGIPSSIDGAKTKLKGGGDDGDGRINGRSVEIKTARLGASQTSFQHELGEHPWKANYIAFVDVAPAHIYLSIFPNFTEEHYKTGQKCAPYFPTKSVTWRKGEGAFKLDTSPNINEVLMIRGNCIKINEKTSFDELGAFINRIVL
jgi:hypothetical protein